MIQGRPLRILHAEASLGWGGQEIRVLTEAREFIRRGHDVRLLCDGASEIASAAPRFGVQATVMPLRRKTLSALRAVRRILSGLNPDIVNCHSSIDHWLSAVARIGLAGAPAIVRTRHIAAPVSRNLPTRWLYNKGCEYVMTTSQAMAGELTGDGFLPAGRVAAVPTGIEIDVFRGGDRAAARKRTGLPEEAFVFGTVSTLRSWKGHSDLLHAFASIDHDSALLVIVGDGPQEANLKAQIDSLRIGSAVRMVGRQEDVVPYLQAMDVFVLPSYANEGIPQALLQAMACELPVIACDIGGIPELIAGLEAARKVPPREVETLAGEMAAIMRACPEGTALAALRGRVEDRYTLQTMYEHVSEVFETAVSCRGLPACRSDAG